MAGHKRGAAAASDEEVSSSVGSRSRSRSPKVARTAEGGEDSGRGGSSAAAAVAAAVIERPPGLPPHVPLVRDPKTGEIIGIDRPARIYCDGIFDLFHYAHARLLKQVKSFYPQVYLLVGVCGDAVTHQHKGKTVLTEAERYESVRHCRWTDEVIEDAPWVITQEFLDAHNIDFVAHDDEPYPSAGHDDVYKFVKDQGRFIATQRTDGVSTSDLITRVVRDYDAYVMRNLKKGYSARDLNISFVKEQEMNLRRNIYQARHRIKENWEKTQSTVRDRLHQIEHRVEETLGDLRHHVPAGLAGYLALFGASAPGSPTGRAASSAGVSPSSPPRSPSISPPLSPVVLLDSEVGERPERVAL